MGTIIISTDEIKILCIKTIIGGFVTIGIILLIDNFFKHYKKVNLPIFIVICGVIFVSTLILIILALSTIINSRSW